MIPILAALALATQPAGPAPVPEDPAPDLAGLQQVYDQSCAAREFGAYDDMCDQLRQQIRAVQAEAVRAARTKRGRRPASKPSPAPAPPAPAASAPPPQG